MANRDKQLWEETRTINGGRGEIVIYQPSEGGGRLEVRLEQESLWLSLNQIAVVFERDKSVISRHLSNVFREGELNREAVVAFFATTASDGKTYKVKYFNLDAIINDIGLAALALLTAESNPRDKDVMIRLTMNMLTRER